MDTNSDRTPRKTQSAPTRISHASDAQRSRGAKITATADKNSIPAIKNEFEVAGNPRTPCKKCLDRMGRIDGNDCIPQLPGPRRTACQFCHKQKKKCNQIHPMFHDAISKALQLGPEQRKLKLREIRKQIERRDDMDEEASRQAELQLQREVKGI
ncbi:hypothetical protein VI817_009529 [Penicillium citrinum]|nr:hypothetical protein VI817_009529 [Penicillium citrinum]